MLKGKRYAIDTGEYILYMKLFIAKWLLCAALNSFTDVIFEVFTQYWPVDLIFHVSTKVGRKKLLINSR